LTRTRLLIGALAAVALATPALARDAISPAAATLFPGSLNIPIADGSQVPSDCEYPDTLRTAEGFDLACIVTTSGGDEDEVDVEYIAWLGANGWRHSANIVGGFAATRATADGCEQVLSIFPHNDEESSGIWFALQREPRCAAPTP